MRASGLGSEGAGELVERLGYDQARQCFGPKFVVASSQVLHEGVAGDDDRSGAVAFESAHRSEPRLKSSVVGLDSVVGELGRDVVGGRQQFDD